jgi:YebC/PmpR family DNA-binding regulatory protein
VALLIQAVTDNRNRTVSDIRRALSRGGGSLGESGSVAWLFDARGYITLPMENQDQDKVFEVALEAGAEDVVFSDDTAEIYTMPTDLQVVRQAFQVARYPIATAEMSMVPKTYISLSPADTLQVMNLIETIEELDDVAKVYSNLEISDEALARIEA